MTTAAPPTRTSRASRRAPPDEAAQRRLGRRLLAIIAIWAMIGFYVVHSQLPSNAVTLPGQAAIHQEIQLIAPQGWAFFTRSPREPQMNAWRPTTAGDWEPALFAPHSEPRNGFGLNRRSRAQPVEMALLSNSAPAEHWRDCDDGDIEACLVEAPRLPIDNPSPRALLCGPIGLSRQEPVPWAWAGASDTSMPATVLRLEVRC